MKNKCGIAGCNGDCHGDGMCLKHYRRLKRGGNPHVPSRNELSLEERFKVGRGPQDPVTGCIEWVGRRLLGGYGRVRGGKKPVLAHRLAWERKHGPVPVGLDVCHECDNPPCCNEAHLYLGTRKENMSDMVGKGRSPKGDKHPNAKLTESDAVEILRRLEAGETQSSLAVAFGVSQSSISLIKTGKNWLHLKQK